MKNDIREYLMEHYTGEEIGEFSDADSLLELGILDSLLMVDLIAHLEKTYGITVDEDDMMPENFDSIEAMVSYIEQKRAGSASSEDCPVSSEQPK